MTWEAGGPTLSGAHIRFLARRGSVLLVQLVRVDKLVWVRGHRGENATPPVRAACVPVPSQCPCQLTLVAATVRRKMGFRNRWCAIPMHAPLIVWATGWSGTRAPTRVQVVCACERTPSTFQRNTGGPSAFMTTTSQPWKLAQVNGAPSIAWARGRCGRSARVHVATPLNLARSKPPRWQIMAVQSVWRRITQPKPRCAWCRARPVPPETTSQRQPRA